MSLLVPHPDATALDAIRAALVLVFAVGQAVMAFWPDLRGWPDTISTRSAALTNPVVPVPPTFAIWGLIFLSCFAFAARHALPANWGDPTLRPIGWIALALVVFASWRPLRVVAGAYLFGAVTIAQFHAQALGVALPSQFLAALPYLATILVLVLIARDGRFVLVNTPSALGKPFVPDR